MTIDTRCPRCGCKLVADQIAEQPYPLWLVQCVNDVCCQDKLSIDGTGPTIEAAVADMMEMHEMTRED